MKCELVLNVPADLFWFDVTFFVCSWDVTFTSVYKQNKVFTVTL